MSEIPSQVTVYDCIEEKYKEEWSGEKCGWNSNRWEQFEREYRICLAEYSDMYQRESIYNAIVEEKAELRELYYEIHETPVEEQVSLYEDEEELQQIRASVENYQKSMNMDGAALKAFNIIAPVVGIDQETITSDMEVAMQTSAQTKNDEEIAKLEANAKEKAEDAGVPEYLVRGAPLRCLYGSHTRYLDLKETHGVYLDDKPLIHSLDCKVDENIFSFGICKCPTATLTETTSLMKGAEVDTSGNYLDAPDDQIITGFLCKPRITGLWKNTNADVQIARNAAAGAVNPSAFANYSAVTNTSYVLCKEGGYIYPLSSGQLEYTSYFAQFLDYPFEDIYSDAFFKWCDIKNVCPYYPGTANYTTWYEDQIEKAKNNKESKQLYEDYLKGSYRIGLDRMSDDEAKKVKEMQEQYLASGLLKKKEANQIQEKYSGLRVDYGYNNQKNVAGATPNETEFYEYFLAEAEACDQQHSELFDEFMIYATEEDTQGIQDVSMKMNEVRAKKAEAYERYSYEIGLYKDVLNEDKEALARKVTEAFGK